jgi:hypothetical protein
MRAGKKENNTTEKSDQPIYEANSITPGKHKGKRRDDQ